MSRAHGPFLFSFLGAVFFACTPTHRDLNSITALFGRDEYTPSRGIGADGWAEGRRRQILKAYLKDRGIPYSENQRIPAGQTGKYRDALLYVKGHGESGTLGISLALKPAKNGSPDGNFKTAQSACDRVLFSFLSKLDSHLKNVQILEFSPTENCLDLTTQLRLQD